MMRRRHWLGSMVWALALPLAHADAYEDFFRAIELDDAAVVADLLRRGFDPNARDPKRQPALLVALFKDSRKAAAVLLQSRSVKVEARNAQDESPLMLAALRGNLPAVQTLLARDADVNKTGWAPLHYAASSGAAQAGDIVRVLLEHHAYIDAASPNGTTPLMMAARTGQIDVARLLLQEGADPNLKNELGLSAIDFARLAGRDSLMQELGGAIRARQPGKGQW